MVKVHQRDMNQLILWVKKHKASIWGLMPRPVIGVLPFEIRGVKHLEFGLSILKALTDRFPVYSIEKDFLTRYVIGKPSIWYKSEKFDTTSNPMKAMNPTSFIASGCDNSEWEANPSVPVSDIILYQIPDGLCSSMVSSIISGQSFVRQLAYNLVQSARCIDGYMIEIDGVSGPIISGENIFRQFCDLADKHSPMSAYSKSYDRDENYNLAMSIEFAESIAAYLLGFIYTGDDARNFNPFIDRPEIKMFIKNFLNARVLNTCHQIF